MIASVVVPALDAQLTIVQQLAALDAQDVAEPFEVIVVDNGSSDGTAAVVAGYRPRRYDLRLVSEPRRGVNRARNAGVRVAHGDAVFLCDSDDQVGDGWLRSLLGALAPGVWVSGALSYERLNSARTRRIWGVPELPRTGSARPGVDAGFGGNCGFSRDMWRRLGGFDDDLSGDGDETEFFLRAWDAGFVLRWVPEAVVHQRLRPGLVGMARRRYRQGRSQVRMGDAAGGRLSGPGLSRAAELRAVAWLMLATPKYLLGDRRYQWLSSMSGHLGRLRGLRDSVGAATRSR